MGSPGWPGRGLSGFADHLCSDWVQHEHRNPPVSMRQAFLQRAASGIRRRNMLLPLRFVMGARRRVLSRSEGWTGQSSIPSWKEKEKKEEQVVGTCGIRPALVLQLCRAHSQTNADRDVAHPYSSSNRKLNHKRARAYCAGAGVGAVPVIIIHRSGVPLAIHRQSVGSFSRSAFLECFA